MTEKPMNGAELKEFHERVRVETLRQLDQITLRKWCVEQAARSDIPGGMIAEVAESIFTFINNKENPHGKSS